MERIQKSGVSVEMRQHQTYKCTFELFLSFSQNLGHKKKSDIDLNISFTQF